MQAIPSRRSSRRPSYGIDAPGLVRRFVLGGAAALALATGVRGLRWSSRAGRIIVSLAGLGACYSLGMGGYMLYGSLVGKVRDRERLLNLLPWAGSETVLDVGCGRGLLLTAAARRVPAGRVVGIDIWQAADQSGNHPDATRANAQVEGVESRIAVQTADMRQVPFVATSFDRVVSHWVVHNLPGSAERAQALAEMARVLKPGGYVLIADIEYHAEYIARLVALGFVGARHAQSPLADQLRRLLSFGSFRPGVVLAQKPVA